MKKLALFLLAHFALMSARSQLGIKDFVQHTAVAIPTISPDSTDFSDLEPIGKAIGDARIVMMGEQDHGDAPTYLAKTRLVKYLHKKKGFNVLAIESDFFSLNNGWDQLPKDSAQITKFLIYNIFPIWTGCDACFPLFREYLPATYKTSSPLQVSGFDNQMMLRYSEHLVPQLDSVLRSLQLPVTTTNEYSQLMLPLIDSMRMWWRSKPSWATFDQCAAYLTRIRNEAAQKLDTNSFWLQVMDNLLQENEEYRLLKKSKNAGNVRDIQMAANLNWLSRVKYPHEKIIVWAASGHVCKVTEDLPGNRLKHRTMGGAFTADSANAAITYVLGFSSSEGTAGRLGFPDYKVPTPKAESFENWVRPKGPYSFVDFKTYQPANARNPDKFYMSGYNHFNVNTVWTKIYDGIFYIEKMYTCKK